jgi:hypothetical protein
MLVDLDGSLTDEVTTPKDLKLSIVTCPKFPDLIRISEFKSNLKKNQERIFLLCSHYDLIWSHFNLKKRPLDVEFVSEGDIILILITKDDISVGGRACSSGEGSSREELCFRF